MLIPVLIFTVVFVACGLVAARVLVRLGLQLVRTGGELERLGTRMDERFLPQVEAVLDQTSLVLRDLEAVGADAREVAQRFEEALVPLGDITVMVDEALQPIVATANSVGVNRRRTRAIRALFGTAFGRLFHPRG